MPEESIKTLHQKDVEKFMQLAGQEVPGSPCVPAPSVRLLRAKLIFEEAMETINALGVEITFRTSNDGGHARSVLINPIEEAESKCLLEHSFEAVELYPINMVDVVDGCCDLKVVTTGTLSAFGVADDEPQIEVDMANLRKFGPGGYRRDDGKWVKPPDFKPPDIRRVLLRQGALPADLPEIED